jgi:hypothetical protein
MFDPAPKKLIVLHTLGSHWNYSRRYPKQFEQWLPSLYGDDTPHNRHEVRSLLFYFQPMEIPILVKCTWH